MRAERAGCALLLAPLCERLVGVQAFGVESFVVIVKVVVIVARFVLVATCQVVESIQILLHVVDGVVRESLFGIERVTVMRNAITF